MNVSPTAMTSCIAFNRSRGSRRNRLDSPPILYHGLKSSLLSRTKDSVVMIVLASGMVEAYKSSVSADAVMKRYPGLILTRKEVFKNLQDSLVGPKETLLRGHKYYLVPESTVRKLREDLAKKDEEKCDEVRKHGKNEHICSAKSFYEKEKCNFSFERSDKEAEDEKKEMPILAPIKKPKMRQGLLWRPSLPTVIEDSP